MRKEWLLVCLMVTGLAACGESSNAAQDATANDAASLMDSTTPPDGTTDGSPDAEPAGDAEVQSDGSVSPTDCSGITANSSYELCVQEQDRCAGVFTDGSGCVAFCAAAGMVCVGRYGGEPGCQQEPQVVLDCYENNGHVSDWCECAPQGGSPTCEIDPLNPPFQQEINKDAATYTQRHNWVLTCYEYAYTAGSTEHQACDSIYQPDGSRTGTATFSFSSVPLGMYEVTIYSRHTENRNPAGALFYVDGLPNVINQVGPNSTGMVWDVHGTYCLEGSVDVILDSTVNSGSDAVAIVRLTPVP